MHVPPIFSNFMNYSCTKIALKLRLGLEKGHRERSGNAKLDFFFYANAIILKIIQNTQTTSQVR